MADIQLVKVDQGAVNERILAREVKVDFRRVEAASVKMVTHLRSAEGKRLFVRYFNSLQLNGHFISVMARTRLKPDDVAKVEMALRAQLEAATQGLNKAIDGAEALFQRHGITHAATYDTLPLVLEVGVISSLGRRYFELLNKVDQIMPLVQTLEIHDVITPADADIQRALFKKMVSGVAGSARNLAGGLRRRMNELASREAEQARAKAQPEAGLIRADQEPAAEEQGAPAESVQGEGVAAAPVESAAPSGMA